MGVRDLLPFVKARAPQAITALAGGGGQLRGLRAAVDVAIEMHRATSVHGTTAPPVLRAWFRKLHDNLRHDGLTPTYVFDGARVAAKAAEAARREEAHAKATMRAREVRQEYAALARKAENALLAELMGEGGGEGDEGDGGAAFAAAAAGAAGERLRKAEARLVRPTRADYDVVRECLEALGATCVVAPTEAEKECARLAAAGVVDVVLTLDSDALPFGAPRTVIGYGSAGAYMVDLPALLTALRLSLPAFRAFCVLCGCDFCDRVPYVGPANAYTLLTTMGVGDTEQNGGLDALLARLDAAKDARFCEAVIAERAAAAERDVGALESELAAVRELGGEEPGGGGQGGAVERQLADTLARLGVARGRLATERAQAAGVAAFKARYAVAYRMFAEPDAPPCAPPPPHASHALSPSPPSSA